MLQRDSTPPPVRSYTVSITPENMATTKTDEEKWSQMQCSTPDWGVDAKNGDHLWCKSSASGDQCYVGSNVCTGRGHRLKCSSCKIIVHTECVKDLLDKMKVFCRMTFQDAENGSYREKTDIPHHWIARKTPKGRCRTCSKMFGGKMCALLNEKVAMSCSWCKEVCHNRDACYDAKKANAEKCKLGEHSTLIVPPTWIVKLPKQQESEGASFAVKPIPNHSSAPLLVFINPKSGGNQGSKLLRTFQWLLNPRQIFDLTQGGPGFGLEMYRRVPNLRILACGGDGTVGWILSVLDDLKVVASPPIAVLPLGTGNDLARALGWGGGYTDEPLSKILFNVEEGEIVKLDRWFLNVSPNEGAEKETKEGGRQCPPLTVVNNYFSLGVDARIALEFHEAREAHPSKFNSRFRNKMFYGQAGGKDLIQRKWKDLSSHVTLECDGQDVTPKLKELKVHSILFLNINSYGGGTKPWGGSGQFQVPRTDDGLIEVIGLTTYQLPLLQAGGHGSPVAQCRKARLVTSCTIPVQVDGEPCRLLPSVIDLELLNTVNMIARTKKSGASAKKESLEKCSVSLKLICLANYEAEHHRKEALREGATPLGTVDICCNTELKEIRSEINKLLEAQDSSRAPDTRRMHWWFLDSCSGDKFFRIDEAQEHLFYAVDVCEDDALYVAEEREELVTQADDDVSRVSTSSSGRDSDRELEIPRVVIGQVPDTPTWEEDEPDYDDPEDNPEEEDYGEEEEEEEGGLRVSSSQEKKLSISSFKIDESEMDIIAAAKMGNLNKLAELHNEGYSLEERDHEGRTALHHAAFIGNIDVVRYLAAYAPIQVLDAQDDILFQTALHRAATRRDMVVCSILVSAGASCDIRDKHGNTPQSLAELVGAKKLAAYLKNPPKYVRRSVPVKIRHFHAPKSNHSKTSSLPKKKKKCTCGVAEPFIL